MVVLEMLMSLNIPSSFEVNWQPHSVCKQERQTTMRWITDRVNTGKHEQSRRYSQEYAFTSVSTPLSLFYLELRDHVLLWIVWDTLVAEQPAAQMLLVVPFKHILLLHEPEQHHRFVKDWLHLLFCQLIKETRDKKQQGKCNVEGYTCNKCQNYRCGHLIKQFLKCWSSYIPLWLPSWAYHRWRGIGTLVSGSWDWENTQSLRLWFVWTICHCWTTQGGNDQNVFWGLAGPVENKKQLMKHWTVNKTTKFPCIYNF